MKYVRDIAVDRPFETADWAEGFETALPIVSRHGRTCRPRPQRLAQGAVGGSSDECADGYCGFGQEQVGIPSTVHVQVHPGPPGPFSAEHDPPAQLTSQLDNRALSSAADALVAFAPILSATAASASVKVKNNFRIGGTSREW
jgi:hypothetical protein